MNFDQSMMDEITNVVQVRTEALQTNQVAKFFENNNATMNMLSDRIGYAATLALGCNTYNERVAADKVAQEKAGQAAAKEAAAKGAGENSVYISKAADGTVQYVGITNSIARRAAEHLASKGIHITEIMGGLSRADARAVEQTLIEINGLGKNGGTLINKINSISVNNPIYTDALKSGYELLNTAGY